MADMLETIANELIMVRKLAVFALLNSGVSQGAVAKALGVSQPTVSRLSGGADAAKPRPVKKKKASSRR